MSNSDFSIERHDHVELFVPDRYQAAEWYKEVFGLQIVSDYEHWAAASGGPLMVANADGMGMLALFEGEAPRRGDLAGFRRVAFRVDGARFLTFLERLPILQLSDQRGRTVAATDIVDHGQAFSIYFDDPYGHHFEITCYEHEQIRAATSASE